MDFIINASQLSVEKHITLPQKAGHAPLRYFVSLDLKNMEGQISRNPPPHQAPLYILGKVFFKMANGAWYTQLMEEGVNQGCPLSSTLLDAALKLHAATRRLDG
jgi:hypothetical protein